MLDRSYMAALALVAACQVPHVTFTLATDADGDSPGDITPDAPLPPSCVGLAKTCGNHRDDDCCNSLPITGGMYYRSYDVASDGSYPDKGFQATVSGFRLDKYEVTVGRFRAFVNAGMGTQQDPPMPGAGGHPNIAGSAWTASWNASLAPDSDALKSAVNCDPTFSTWTAGNDDRPMNCVTWYEATAFCAWDGGYLATEAEWNYAAAGGDQQRAYPWSNPPGSLTPLDGSHTSFSDGTNCVGDGSSGCAVTDLVAVGTKPLGDGRWGHSDLAGNVYEWTLDWHSSSYAIPCTDCASLTPGSQRVVRGGGFDREAIHVRTADRGSEMPVGRFSNLGVRCARTL